MKSFQPRNKHGPEWYIQQDLIKMLVRRGWFVKVLHGNVYQHGMPDLFAAHPRYGTRLIDCKNPARYTFTAAQRIDWPLMRDAGVGIWIITAATEEEYEKLMNPPNWESYWKPEWDAEKKELDGIMDYLNSPEAKKDDESH